MKKNVLRILLALVLVAFVFALVACGGGDDSTNPPSNNNNNNDNNNDNNDPADENEAGDLATELTKLMKTLNPYLTALKEMKADSTLGLDLGVEGYFVNKEKTKHNFELGVAANASKKDPEVKLGVSVDDVDYFALGYSNAALYLLEGLNMINSDEKKSNKIKMDVSMLKTGIDGLAGIGIDKLAELLPSLLKDVDLEAMAESLFAPSDGGVDLASIASGLISVKSGTSSTQLIVDEDSVASLIGMLTDPKGLLGNVAGTINGYVTTVLEYVNKILGDVLPEPLTMTNLTGKFCPALKVVAGYKGEALNSVAVVIDFTGTQENDTLKKDRLGIELGLNINLNTLSLDKKADISFDSYKKQVLSTSIMADLPIKGLNGKLTAEVNTAEALAKKDSWVADAAFRLYNDSTKLYDKTCAEAMYDGQTISLKIYEECFTELGAKVKGIEKNGSDTTSYVYTLTTMKVDENGNTTTDAFNIKTELVTLLEKTVPDMINNPKQNDNNSGSGSGDASASGEKFDLMALVNKYIVLADKYAGKYLKFALVDDKNEALSLETIFDGIKSIYDENKDLILNAGDANKDTKTAGIQFYDKNFENPSVIAFVSKFVKVPAIVNGEVNLDVEAWEITHENVVAYVNISESVKADVDYWMLKIAGFNSDYVLENGIYAYAKAGEGLEGYVGLKTSKDGETYAEIGANIMFSTAISGIAANAKKYATMGGEEAYDLPSILFTEEGEVDENSMLMQIRDAFLDYQIAEEN